MATLKNIFDKCGVALYQNESLDLDHYYQDIKTPRLIQFNYSSAGFAA